MNSRERARRRQRRRESHARRVALRLERQAADALWRLTGAGPGPAADWDPSMVRHFYMDFDDGDDNNNGASKKNALRTMAELNRRLPHNGNGRSAVVLLKPGSQTNESLDISSTGYKLLGFRSWDLDQ